MNQSSSTPKLCPRSGQAATMALASLLASHAASADLFVDANVTQLSGSFRYDLTITNNESEDLALVTFTDAPIGDPLIASTLIVPLGFLGSYDSVLGFVDFLADSAVFPANGTVSGFSFESASSPSRFFGQVEGLSVNGVQVAGSANTTVVPEGRTLAAAGMLAACAAYAARRNRTRTTSPARASA